MSNQVARELTSIIIPCWNQIEFTQQCIAALKSHTRPAWELSRRWHRAHPPWPPLHKGGER
jgi:hypothetical protein